MADAAPAACSRSTTRGESPRLDARAHRRRRAGRRSPGLLVRYRHDDHGRAAEVLTDRNTAWWRGASRTTRKASCTWVADATRPRVPLRMDRYGRRRPRGAPLDQRRRAPRGPLPAVEEPDDAPPLDDPGVAVGETSSRRHYSAAASTGKWNDEHQILGYTGMPAEGPVLACPLQRAAPARRHHRASTVPPRAATTTRRASPCSRTDALGRTRGTGYTDFGLPLARKPRPTAASTSTPTATRATSVRETDPLGRTRS